ncbi:MAG: putative manganese transporter [Eggerthellaceae bacterium]|nr:putative manganese transporter [Eggerthellaceae bacterium]
MELLPHLLEHAFEDTIYLVPFLLATYILLELLEHKAGDKAAVLVRKAGIAGPFVGSLLGAVPQCGFSAAGSALYASRAITLGTLFAVFLSTSDEMLPLFIAEQVDPLIMLSIIGTKIAIGMIMGFAIDGALRLRVRSEVKHEEKRLRDLGHGVCCTHTENRENEHEHEHGRKCDREHESDHEHENKHKHKHEHEHELDHEYGHKNEHENKHEHGLDHDHGHERKAGVACSHEHSISRANSRNNPVSCTCPHGHHLTGTELEQPFSHHHCHNPSCSVSEESSSWKDILISALKHTLQVTIIVYLISFALVAVMELAGEDVITNYLVTNPGIAIFGSALVGLIPNCGASVVITQLYLDGMLGTGAMISGLLVSAGVGILVLFSENHRLRQNIFILVGLLIIGVAWGSLFELLGITFM